MESAGVPWEKKFCFARSSTICRPRPAVARKDATSKEILFSSFIRGPLSRCLLPAERGRRRDASVLEVGQPGLAIFIETLVCTTAGPCMSFPGGLAYPVFHPDVEAHCAILLTSGPPTGSLSWIEPVAGPAHLQAVEPFFLACEPPGEAAAFWEDADCS